MTVQELIDQLSKIENKDKQVVISVHTSTQRYPVAYTSINPMDGFFQQTDHEVRLYTWLPDNMYAVERKRK